MQMLTQSLKDPPQGEGVHDGLGSSVLGLCEWEPCAARESSRCRGRETCCRDSKHMRKEAGGGLLQPCLATGRNMPV